MAFGAQSGALNVTPNTHVVYAGENIDQIAQRHVQVASGERGSRVRDVRRGSSSRKTHNNVQESG